MGWCKKRRESLSTNTTVACAVKAPKSHTRQPTPTPTPIPTPKLSVRSGQRKIRLLPTYRWLDNSRWFGSGSGERGRRRGRGWGRGRYRSVPLLLSVFLGLLFLFDPLRLASSRFSGARAWTAKLMPEDLLESRGTNNAKQGITKNTKTETEKALSSASASASRTL